MPLQKVRLWPLQITHDSPSFCGVLVTSHHGLQWIPRTWTSTNWFGPGDDPSAGSGKVPPPPKEQEKEGQEKVKGLGTSDDDNDNFFDHELSDSDGSSTKKRSPRRENVFEGCPSWTHSTFIPKSWLASEHGSLASCLRATCWHRSWCQGPAPEIPA